MKKYRYLIFVITAITIASCMKHEIDIQGHRGCRGLMPENTIEAFLKACELGVNTLEMDAVVSADGQVIISHEPFFNHEISISPFGTEITAENEMQFNIYEMTHTTVQRFDVGSKVHPRFPDQKKIKAYKPILSEVVNAVEKAGFHPKYNIEIKRNPAYDGTYHPDVLDYSKLVIRAIKDAKIENVTTIQSFDHECLNICHLIDASIKTVMLVEDANSMEWHLAKLDHKPYGYSPDFHLVDANLVKTCRDQGIKLIPWTVNEVEDIEKMVNFGVDGIISDYPDRVIKMVR